MQRTSRRKRSTGNTSIRNKENMAMSIEPKNPLFKARKRIIRTKPKVYKQSSMSSTSRSRRLKTSSDSDPEWIDAENFLLEEKRQRSNNFDQNNKLKFDETIDNKKSNSKWKSSNSRKNKMWSLSVKSDKGKTKLYVDLHPKVQRVVQNALDKLEILTSRRDPGTRSSNEIFVQTDSLDSIYKTGEEGSNKKPSYNNYDSSSSADKSTVNYTSFWQYGYDGPLSKEGKGRGAAFGEGSYEQLSTSESFEESFENGVGLKETLTRYRDIEGKYYPPRYKGSHMRKESHSLVPTYLAFAGVKRNTLQLSPAEIYLSKQCRRKSWND